MIKRRRRDWPPPPPANLWVVVIGAIWCTFLVQFGIYLAEWLR